MPSVGCASSSFTGSGAFPVDFIWDEEAAVDMVIEGVGLDKADTNATRQWACDERRA